VQEVKMGYWLVLVLLCLGTRVNLISWTMEERQLVVAAAVVVAVRSFEPDEPLVVREATCKNLVPYPDFQQLE